MIAPALLTARDALPIYLSLHPRLRESSVREIGYNLNRWERHSGNPFVQNITADTFDAFRTACKCGPVTVENTINAVIAILTACEARGVVQSSPGPGNRLNIPEPEPVVVGHEVLSAIYRRADVVLWPGQCRQKGRGRGSESKPHDWAPAFWRTFIVTAYFTGLRLGDLLKLQPSDFRGELLGVVAQKTGKRQSIPIHPVLSRHLREVTWAKADELLFPVGGSMSQFRRELKRICTRAGVEHVTPQTIRILAANEWERARPRAGDAILGHAIRRRQTRYYLRAPLALEEALPNLRVPRAFLTETERRKGQNHVRELLLRFERMDSDGKELILKMARKMG